MEQETSNGRSMREVLAGVGVTVTDEGVARARRRLQEAHEHRDPAAWDAMRERLGLSSQSA